MTPDAIIESELRQAYTRERQIALQNALNRAESAEAKIRDLQAQVAELEAEVQRYEGWAPQG